MPLHLVLLPGMDGTGDLFAPLEETLAGRLPVHRMAYPTDQPMGYAQLAPWIRERLPAEPFVLLGESFSGPLAIELAAHPPAQLRGVVLCCTFAQAPRRWLAPFQALASSALLMRWTYRAALAPMRWALLGRYATPSLNALLSNAVLQVQPAVLARRLHEVSNVDVLGRLRGIRVPALALNASDDRLIPRTCAQAMQQALPALQAVRLTGPHCLLQAAPAASAQALLDWCHRLEPPTA